MNFNFSSFLNGSLKILNIANKTLPLIKEASPTIKSFKDKYNKFKGNNKNNILNNTKSLPYIEKKTISKDNNNLNLPTFFK